MFQDPGRAMSGLVEGHDAGEFQGIKARSTDERSIDVPLGHERGYPLVVYRSSVLDPQPIGYRGSVVGCDRMANCCAYLPGVLGGSGTPGTYGPDGLVRD